MTLYTQKMNVAPLAPLGTRICVMRNCNVYNRHLRTFFEKHGCRMFDYHFTFLAPSDELKQAYVHDNLPWGKYVSWFEKDVLIPQRMVLISLGIDALTQDITLLCTEPTPEHCHRRLLAQEMKRLVPNLEVRIE